MRSKMSYLRRFCGHLEGVFNLFLRRKFIILLSAFSLSLLTVAATPPLQLPARVPSGKTVDCSRVECRETGSCRDCQLKGRCVYGQETEYICTLNSACKSRHPEQDKEFSLWAECRYCWQTEAWEHICESPRNCSVGSTKLIQATCTVNQSILCLGRRSFYKRIRCNWTHGYKWSTAVLLSVTLGGFGVDRFYLGLWKSAIGKLFSFGGLGVWTVIDLILIAAKYVTPADGSMYI